jgi:hypothetical protein
MYPGGRVDGVNFIGDKDTVVGVNVYLTLNQCVFGQPLIALGDAIRDRVDKALRALGDHRVSNVIIEDLLLTDRVEGV